MIIHIWNEKEVINEHQILYTKDYRVKIFGKFRTFLKVKRWESSINDSLNRS